jgi:ferredoxin
MAYVVGEQCIRCKFMDCVEVCPVDCFYEGENMLAINPDECIDCGVCEPECPAEAIFTDTSAEGRRWVELNDRMSRIWPNIAEKGVPPEDSGAWLGVEGKFDSQFTERAAGEAA